MDYKYIRAWGDFLHSQQNYIDGEVKAARETKAPENAVFRKPDGSWETFDNVNPTTQQQIAEILKHYE